jgi:hypothetical protein
MEREPPRAGREQATERSTVRFRSTVALALSLTGQLQILGKPSDKPDVKYDKFDDVTVISTNLGKIPGDDGTESRILLIASHEGKKPYKYKDARVLIVFSRVGENLKWKDDTIHEVRMVCGDDRIPLWPRLPEDYESKSTDTFCVESFSVRMNLKKVKEFLEKKRDWEIKIDFDDPFVLDAKTRKKMLEYVRFLEEGKG